MVGIKACVNRSVQFTVLVLGCAEEERFKMDMKEAKNVYNSLLRANEILEEARCRYNPQSCIKTKYPTIPQPNVVQVFEKLLQPSTDSIKDQGKVSTLWFPIIINTSDNNCVFRVSDQTMLFLCCLVVIWLKKFPLFKTVFERVDSRPLFSEGRSIVC